MITETTCMNASRAFSHCETQGIRFPALENQVPHWFVKSTQHAQQSLENEIYWRDP